MTVEQALQFAETTDRAHAALQTLAAEVRRLEQKRKAVIQKLNDTAHDLEHQSPDAVINGSRLSANTATGYAMACREAIRLLS